MPNSKDKSLDRKLVNTDNNDWTVRDQILKSIKKILITCIAAASAGAILFYYINIGTQGANSVTIRYWNLFTGPDGKTMLELVKKFNQTHPEITIRMQRMKLHTYYNKLFVAGLGNRTPDVFIIHASAVERFVKADLLRPVNELLLSQNGIPVSDFSDKVIQSVIREKSIYGVPLDTHIIGMYYNVDLLKETGFTDSRGIARPPSNRQEFMEILKRNTMDIDNNGRNDKWGFAFTWLRTNIATVMWQFGGEFFNEDYTQCTLNSADNIEALEFCTNLVNKYKFSPPPGTEQSEGWIGFRQGKVAITLEGVYMLTEIKKLESLNIAGSPVPVLGRKRAAWADSHIICLNRDLKEKKLTASWKFVKFLSDNSLEWAAGGQVPARKSLLKSEEFREMEIQSEFARQLDYIHYMPKVPFIGEFCAELEIAAEKALRGSLSPKRALDIATERVNKVIKRYQQGREYGDE